MWSRNPRALRRRQDAKPPANPVRRLIALIVMAIERVLFIYGIAADRITPYTAQALVQAYLVKIAPEVGGRVIEVGVGTDQRVEAGKVLFRIEPDQYVLAVRRAEAQLETIGQSLGASTAAVATAQAKLVEAIALRENARDQTNAPSSWSRRGSIPKHAGRRRRRRSIRRGHRRAGPGRTRKGKADPRPRGCRQSADPRGHGGPGAGQPRPPAHHVLAPSEGGVTNLSLGVGQVLSKGEAAMTYIDIREVWIEAAFREVSLENIHIGDPVEIVLDLYPGRVFAGRVSAVGYGVGNRDVDARTGLPSPRSQSGWIRAPQPMPVRIEFDRRGRRQCVSARRPRSWSIPARTWS